MTPLLEDSCDKSLEKRAEELLLEKLSDSEHERWARWQKYLFSRCKPLPMGGLAIDPEDVKHWMRQIETEYSELSEREKDSDRKEARRTIELMLPALRAERQAAIDEVLLIVKSFKRDFH